ncbi:MAG: sigma-70 family RNA polymerase sigma factor [Duncaniella sp.]|uniref:RNA polymerase sigma factor n=1 Tax=Duncaniella sp. TaxID=2518496 RepID=UPI0023CD1298|nr:sigma-70 family RNA polymerase sigma factor [Duncaniella sp.]MDE5987816.1 sigma-70 family RNA polymerase sigma factor [Duncaniella sp.]
MEANIIYRIAKGDEMAFDAFMDHYSSALFHYAYGIVGSKESAEEVVSDVFFEVWKGRKTILEIESMEAWLRTVTYRKAVSCLRHESSTPSAVPLDEVENFTVSPVSAPDSDLISREEIEELNRAIEELPPKCRHVFFLAKIDCLPYKEISQMLEISVATINYHVGFAMDALKKKLRRREPPPD